MDIRNLVAAMSWLMFNVLVGTILGQSVSSTLDENLDLCPPHDIEIIQRQVFAYWFSADAASIKIFMGEEYFRRLRNQSDDIKAIIDMMLPTDMTRPESKVAAISMLNSVNSYLSVLHRTDILVEYIRFPMKAFASVPGITPEVVKVTGKVFRDMMLEAVSCLDQVAWNSCFQYINNIVVKELKEELKRQQKSARNSQE